MSGDICFVSFYTFIYFLLPDTDVVCVSILQGSVCVCIHVRESE